jgi:hypothetical protein
MPNKNGQPNINEIPIPDEIKNNPELYHMLQSPQGQNIARVLGNMDPAVLQKLMGAVQKADKQAAAGQAPAPEGDKLQNMVNNPDLMQKLRRLLKE